MKLITKISFLLIAFVTFSCSSEPEIYEDIEQLVMASKESTKKIKGDLLLDLIENGNNLQIIDCREENLFAEGHIKGAINVPRGLLEFSDKLTNRRLTTVVFGNDMGSAILAVNTLQKLKYRNCFWIDCKWDEWAKMNPDRVETGGAEVIVKEKEAETSGGCGG